MNRYKPTFLSFRRSAGILGGLLILVFSGFYFLTVSAKTETVKNSEDRNLVLGKIAFMASTSSFASPQVNLMSANADGTGIGGLVAGLNPPLPAQPAWSPDGTKVVYTDFGPRDILVVNADGTNRTNLSNTPGISETNAAWSVLGKIAYVRDNKIWTMNDNGTNQAEFTGITQPTPFNPAWSPDGSKLAFVSNGEIWKINADGTNEQRVTLNATTDYDPSWSSDGTKIVFNKGTVGIAAINADGTNEVILTSNSTDSHPSWSSDGTKIAFARGTPTDGNQGGIFLMNPDGSGQQRIIANIPGMFSTTYYEPNLQPIAQTLNTFIISGRITRNNVSLGGVTVNLNGTTNATATTDAAGNYQFSGLTPGGNYSISPSFLNHYFTPPNRSFSNLNGNQIADFTATGVCTGLNCAQNGKIAFDRGSEIFTMNSDGTNQTNITNNAAIDTSPNYSPDGSKIIFSTNRDGNNEIYQMNADGSNPIRLTNNVASDTSPYYSPDGTFIVFVSDRDGNNEIYKMNANGSNPVRLTNDPANNFSPAVSPNGQKIIFVTDPGGFNQSSLFTINANGTNLQSLTTSGFYNRPSYSPDATKIIFVYGFDVTAQRVWTANADGSNGAVFYGFNSPSYSPDGTKALSTGLPTTTFTSGVFTVNSDGNSNSSLRITDQGSSPDWQPILSPRRTAFDFDGDGRSDVSVFRPSNSGWYLLQSTAGLWVPVWGTSSDVLVPADYDGDLKTDVAIWRPTDGNFYVLNSFNFTVRVENFGLSGDVPTGGDWDGDGKADVAVYRGGANGVFYYRGSMGNPQGNITSVPWGVSGDKPVVGDYDGDGRTDAAIYRNGIWYIRQSSNGQLIAFSFGLVTDVIIPADYDADGKTDPAVYRGGTWYLLRSTQGFTAFPFGISNDIPAPADYDGDGRADAAIYRNGVWWILKTQSGTTEGVSFGVGSDKPIPSAFVR
jgi:Tol biopolymer transport system component